MIDHAYVLPGLQSGEELCSDEQAFMIGGEDFWLTVTCEGDINDLKEIFSKTAVQLVAVVEDFP